MKKVLSCILSILILCSIIVVPVMAGDLSVNISGRRTKTMASFAVRIENNSSTLATAVVYVATFEADTSFKNVEKFVVPVAGGGVITKTYTADISSGNAKIFVWDEGIIPLKSLSAEDCSVVESLDGQEINVGLSDVWASNLDADNPAYYAVDGNINTAWVVSAAESNPEDITMYLGDDYILASMTVQFDSEAVSYRVFSSEDGENFAPVSDVKEVGGGISLTNTRARFVKIEVYSPVGINELAIYGFEDNQGSVLMSPEEMADFWQISAMDEMTYTGYRPTLGDKLYGETDEDALVLYDAVGRDGSVDGERLSVSSVTASQTPESANAPNNVIDMNMSTIWTASEVTDSAPATLVADLGSIRDVTGVGIAFGNGASRTYTYSVALSSDNRNFTTIVGKTTAQSTDDIQKKYFSATEARYIKYTFYARVDSSNNGWIRVSEIQIYTGEASVEGAGGVMAQKSLNIPSDRKDYEITFDMTIPSEIDGENTDPFFSGIALTDGIITGGADLDNYTALQLRLDNNEGKVAIKQLASNYFNEGDLKKLFEKSFNKDEKLSFSLLVSPQNRCCFVTVEDSVTTETQVVYFSYSDAELTRNVAWSGYEANTIVFNTGAGSKNKMTVENLKLRQVDRNVGALPGEEPVNGIVRLEATRLSTYPTNGSEYYGRYIYHSGNDGIIKVAANKNPALARFVERRGLMGTGVSFEAVTMPGHFIVSEGNNAYYLKKFENTGEFMANATFYKEEAENVGYYTGNTYKYRAYRKAPDSANSIMEDKYLYDSTTDYKTGDVKPWKMWNDAQGTFYLRNEATAYVSDNFNGNQISSQWWKNYPWKGNNPTNDSYNFTALITKNNVIVENGELLLKATKIAADAWPTDTSGETGKQYNGDYGRNDWKKWQGYVGVVSIQNKVYNKQCFVEGRFKDPNSPIGYWNAFWLTGRDSWPPEIDIFETLSSKYGHNAWHTAIHGEGDKDNRFGKQTSSINIATSYHTFSMDWGYDYIKFYVDGNMFASTQNDSSLAFQKNMRLIMNTGIGGWENEPDSTMVWDDGLRCQYIRTFQY